MSINNIKIFTLLFSFFIFNVVKLYPDTVSTNDKLTTVSKLTTTNEHIINAPVHYSAKDSIIITLKNENKIYMFGESSVQYKNLNLSSDYIEIDANKNTVLATFALDSIGNEIGAPIFEDGKTQYKIKKICYNFKTKKMFINDVFTKQNEWYMTAIKAKKMPNNDLYIKNGRYTTCNEDPPHFYFQITKAKIQPQKKIITGPTYLVLEGIPLPIVLPFCFFSQKSNYASGIIMPSYGDEMTRGFSFQNGGYYFAINDYLDLSVTGSFFSKGSWGLNANSTYKKRYKSSGNIQINYRYTTSGEKLAKNFSPSKDANLSWTHNQDPKANPFSTLSASVNLSTNSYNKNDLNTLYSEQQHTNNSQLSSINYRYNFFDSPFSININTSINQIHKNSTLDVIFPNLILTMRNIYPFKKYMQTNTPKWYENIYINYSMIVSNAIQGIKEYDFFKKKTIKDCKSGIKHDIPTNISFNLFKHIIVTQSVNYTELWYFSRINQKYDLKNQKLMPTDTIHGFYRICTYNINTIANTKLYGIFNLHIINKWIKKIQFRHILNPTISLNSSPDYSNSKYKLYEKIHTNNHDTIYSPFSNNLWGVPKIGKSKIIDLSLNNNLELKYTTINTNYVNKISLIDNLRLSISYNYSVDSINWSDISTSARFKLRQHIIEIQGIFDPYIYNKKGIKINTLRFSANKNIGRLKSANTSFSCNLNNEIVKNWFNKNDNKNLLKKNNVNNNNIFLDKKNINHQKNLSQKVKYPTHDEDGYILMNISWDLNFNYSFSLAYNTNAFNKSKMEYFYQINQMLNISGCINPTKNWSINFNTNYNFNNNQFTDTSYYISRKMHCWTMAINIIPIGPFKSYYFTIAANSSILKDLKYTKSGIFMGTS
jgi:hypothetical protein